MDSSSGRLGFSAGEAARFRFQSLPPGRVHIRVYSPVPFIQFKELDGIEIPPGDSINIDSVVLVRTSTAHFTSLVPDGLIAYWPFDEGAGSGTAGGAVCAGLASIGCNASRRLATWTRRWITSSR